jgi:signal transduction histidine kinase
MVLGTLVPAASTVAALALWPLWHEALFVALATLALFAALFAIGVTLLAEPGQGPVGLAMIVAAALLIVSWANEWGKGPLPLASVVVGNLWVPVVGWALYRYPSRQLDHGDRWVFLVVLGWIVVTPWLLVFLSRPQWHQYPAHCWWPALFPSHAVYQIVTRVVDVGTVIVGLLYVSRWVVRLPRARGLERSVKVPTAMAGTVAIAIGSSLYIAYAVGVPGPVDNFFLAITTCGMLAVPIAFLVAVIRRYLRRNALTQVLISMGNSPTTRQITAALREGLQDPDLNILYWSKDEHCFLDEARRPVDDPRGEAGQLLVDIESSTGDRLARMIADAALEQDLDLIDAAVVAVGFSMENALLLETVQAQLADLQAASARIIRAGAEERRRIQQDLHDGIQGRLAALGPRLGAVKATTTDPRTADRVADIRDALSRTLTDLRKLVAGMRLDVLSLGLATAVTDLCGNYQPGLAIAIDLPDVPLPEPVEDTAFLAISEAMANVAKHARARSVDISGRLEGGTLVVSVMDDGVGGAALDHGTEPAGVTGDGADDGRLDHGTGLVSITDRITALQGRVQIVSPPGRGTRVTMRIPCA